MQKIVQQQLTNLPLPNNKDNSIWVFGYASLIWDPGFQYTDAFKAQIIGYHRSFCVWSTTYRGTPEAPGLVMGLAQGGYCDGKAFKVNTDYLNETMNYLYEREMDTMAYLPTVCPVVLNKDNENEPITIEALTFVVNPNTPVYACGLSAKEKAQVINKSYGSRGANTDYALKTFEHLQSMDIHDNYLRSIIDEL